MVERWKVIDRQNNVLLDEGWDWCAFASSHILYARRDGKEGLYDLTSRRLFFPLSFKSIRYNDQVIVVDEGVTYLMSVSDRKISSRTFGNVQSFSEGLAAAKRIGGDSYGFINVKGEWVIRPQFYHVTNFHEGLSAVMDHSGRHFYIDRTGEKAISGQFVNADSFSEGLAHVRTAEGDFYINRKGEIVLAGGDDWFAGGHFYGGRASVLSRRHPEMVYFIDKAGLMIGDSYFHRSGRFSEGMAPVAMNNLWGEIDVCGSLRIPYSFQSLSARSCGLAAATLGEKYGYVDANGSWTIQPQYTVAGYFYSSNQLACVAEE